MVQIKAVLFDLDGTLIDSEVIYVEAIRQALENRRCSLTREESESLVYGKGARDIYFETLRLWPDSYSSFEEMELDVRHYFVKLKAERNIRIEGSIDLLHRLAREFPVAIVSGSPRADIEAGVRQIEAEGLLRFFLGAEDYFPGKPDPACYLMAAARMGLAARHCLVFEDSHAGVVAAKTAGAFCVGLRRNGFPFQDLSLADAVYSDLGQFRLDSFLAHVGK